LRRAGNHLQARYQREANVTNGFISTSSPIGKGLLGKKVGDGVRVASPGGVRELEF
jgi:transcription elongation factor GreA